MTSFSPGRSLGTWNRRSIMPSPSLDLYLSLPAKVGGPANHGEPELAYQALINQVFDASVVLFCSAWG